MKDKLKALRFRMLLPVFVLTFFTVLMLSVMFGQAYINAILQQENEVNAVGFETISQSITPLIDTSISAVRSIMTDDRIASYAQFQYFSLAEMLHARISCRDYLSSEIARNDGIYGMLFMRKDESLFGALPEGSFFFDFPKDNPLPEDVKTQILSVPRGQTVWIGPLSATVIYGFENEKTLQNVMICTWQTVNVRYGECFVMLLMDESIFDRLFSSLQDGKSTWRLFTADQTEFYHSGPEPSADPEQLIRESDSGKIFHDENDQPLCAFSMTMTDPQWTLVREVSMENYEKVVRSARIHIGGFTSVVFLIALLIYELWLKKFMRQFNSLQDGIVRIGQGDLEPIEFEPFTIREFDRMQLEINKTSLALNQQMDTIRRMEREQIEQENRIKEQERIEEELSMAREIQANALPQVFPPFPDRTEFELFASMTPAKEVGGDFYDFFLIDNDHLALVIADVSGKGIPAALFMMVSKGLIRNQLMTGCDPAAALEQVNLQLSERNSSMMFVTVWLAVLEISTGKGMACNAGHESPGLRRAGGSFELLDYDHDMFIGVLKKAKYRNREFELYPGDCIFVYTDGVPEANDADNTMFGKERLIETLNQNSEAGPEELVHRVYDAVNQFAGDAPQFDDITMLAFEFGEHWYGRNETERNQQDSA